jgi:hypothetical protein
MWQMAARTMHHHALKPLPVTTQSPAEGRKAQKAPEQSECGWLSQGN